jgi:hypothetical protein
MGVEEALRQWLRDLRPTGPTGTIRESIPEILPAPPKSPERPPSEAPAPAKQQPAEKEEQTEFKDENAWPERTVSPADAQLDVEVFDGIDLLPVLAAAAWLIDREEEERADGPC